MSGKIIVLEKVDSTNNYAMALIKNGETFDGNAVFALEQTNGKGRRGKNWNSKRGKNILLSITAEMHWLHLFQQFQVSASVALACYDFISKYNPGKTSIKWPNDIFINDSKAGGVLIENVIKGTLWQWSVIGIGININQTEFDDYDLSPVSLKQITGKDYDVLQMAGELHVFVSARLENLRAGNFSQMLEEYNQKLFAANRVVKLKKDNMVFETKILHVSSTGQLITYDTLERRFNFDEVVFKGFAKN